MDEAGYGRAVAHFALRLPGGTYASQGIAVVSPVTRDDLMSLKAPWLAGLSMILPDNFESSLIGLGAAVGQIDVTYHIDQL